MVTLKQTKLIRPPPGIDVSQPRYPNTKYLYAVTAFASLGALLFGYDQGVMGVIVADKRWIGLMHPKNSCESTVWLDGRCVAYNFADRVTGVTGTVVSLYDIGCFIGALSLGYLADPIGRERTLAVASVVFIIGAILQATAYSITQIVGYLALQYPENH
jgi:MFS family permease